MLLDIGQNLLRVGAVVLRLAGGYPLVIRFLSVPCGVLGVLHDPDVVVCFFHRFKYRGEAKHLPFVSCLPCWLKHFQLVFPVLDLSVKL